MDGVHDTTVRTPFWPARFDDAGLDVYAVRVLIHIWRRAGSPEGDFRESSGKAALACRMSERRFRQALAILEGKGWIQRTECRPGVPKRFRPTESGTPVPRAEVLKGKRKGPRCPVPTPPVPRAGGPRCPVPTEGTPLKVLPEGTPLLLARCARSRADAPSRVERTEGSMRRRPTRTDNGAMKRTRAAVLVPVVANGNGNGKAPWSREAADLWTTIYRGQPPGAYFAQLKRIIGRYTWARVRPVLELVLVETPVEYLNIPKVLGGSFEALEARLPAGPRPRGQAGRPTVDSTLAAYGRIARGGV